MHQTPWVSSKVGTPLAVGVVPRVAELEGEVDGDRLKLRQFMPGHRLHVLVEPGVAASERSHGEGAEGERDWLAARVRQAGRHCI